MCPGYVINFKYKMIIDCFPFCNELDVLEIRLRELWDVVNWFVLVEANKTQCLNSKPFYFEENQSRFQKYLSKIAHVKIQDTSNEKDRWAMEHHQRNKICEGISKIPKLKLTDMIMISDCDEIPSAYQVLEAQEELKRGEKESFSLGLKNCAFKLNLEVEGPQWIGTAVTTAEKLQYNPPQDFRDFKDNMLFETENKGWHFSYMGGKEQVYKKFFSCIEPYNKEVISSFEEFSVDFDRKIKEGGSFLFSDKKDDSKRLFNIPLKELPECLRESEDFNHLISK